jgi:menaquinone-dependent protoporphyrinogen oxidase
MNENKILIAYATTSGSTQEIADFVARALTGQGLAVELRLCREVKQLNDYNAVVIGAPIYMFHLHKDAMRFLQRHRQRLLSLPAAVFAGGPYGPNAAEDAVEVRKNLDNELAKLPWFQPVSVQLVGGRFDPARLRFPYNLIPALKQAPACDGRDWAEIRAWALSLPSLLAVPLQQPALA